MNDCINISARVDDKPDMLCPWEKLYGRRPTSPFLPFMMPGFRHAIQKTKMHLKGERCFYLNTGHDHSCTAHKFLLASGVASYTADVTFGHHCRPFVGESPTWGDGAVVSSPPSPQQPQLMGAEGGAGAVEHQRARPQQQQRPPHSMGAGGGAGVVEYQRARPQQHQRPPHSMGAEGGAGAVEHQQARPQQHQRSPHPMGAGGGAEAVEHQRARPQQQQRPPHSMGAGGGAGAVEYQRARPQQHQRPPHSMGAEGGAGAVEYQRARPQQHQRPPHSMGAGGGAGAVEHQRARPQQQQRPPYSTGAGGGAGAVEYQRAWPQQQQQPPQLMGAGGGAGAVEYQRARPQQQQRPPPHSMGAGVGAGAEETQQQRQSPQQELEPLVLTDGAAAATSATDRWIPATERPTGDGTIPGGGSGAGTVAATSTRRQQDHLVVRSSSPGPLQQKRYRVTPAVTRSRSREQPTGVSRTFTHLAAEEDIARTLAQPDAVFCDSEELPAGPAHLLETPETYAQAHAGPHDRIWAKAERKKVKGLSAVGTFVEEGGTQQRGTNIISAK